MSKVSQLVVVYQPHQNSRQHKIRDQYTTVFAKADKVYWLDTYLSREDPDLEILDKNTLVQGLPSYVEAVDWDRSFLNKLQLHRKNQDLIVFMGAGSIDKWARDWLRIH